jgi:DNA polymerase-1
LNPANGYDILYIVITIMTYAEEEMRNFLLIDGNSLLNRAFYGVRPLTTKDGLPTNAVYGFVTMLKKHIDSIKPSLAVCTFDLKAPTFRHKMYDGYKATRHGMPDELAVQLPYAKEAAAALGMKVCTLEGYEADDILGTLSKMGDEAGDVHTYVVTGDRDSLQLISEGTSVVLVKTKEDIVYTPDKFTSEYGVTPTQYIDVKALMGDSSDNIPGVRGIGEKTAFKLIAESGSLDELYRDVTAYSKGAAAARLTEGKDSAYLSRTLAEICRTAPLDISVDDCAYSGCDSERLVPLFTKLEFTKLLEAFAPKADCGEQMQSDIGFPNAEVISPSRLLEITDSGEFSAAYRREGDSFSVSVCIGGALYSSSMSPDEFALFFSTRSGVIHDFKRLCTDLLPMGVEPLCAFDTMLAMYLISPGESSYPIEKLALQYAGFSGDVSSSEREACIVYAVYPAVRDRLESDGMSSLLHDMEIPLSLVLADMEIRGMRLDCDGLMKYIGALTDMQNSLADQIFEIAGTEFNLNSPKQLGEVLFEKLELPPIKKTKTGYSTNAEILEKLKPYHPIISMILDWRHVSKLVSTYGAPLAALADENGRVHTRFNQTGTATGRLSSLEPNMQNIPVRGEMGRELRRYFTAGDENHVLIDADYSQIELRLLAAISGDSAMSDAFISGEDIHTATASQVFHIPRELVTKELRSRAKAVNFGIVYGIGDYSLSQDIGVSRKTAGEYIKNYLATYPAVDAYLKGAVADAEEKGYTATLFGRRRPIPELKAKNKMTKAFGERVAMNSPIQGTAADIIKVAMINVHRALKESGLDAHLILQVHDELIVEASSSDAEAAAEILRREMENAAALSVPLTAETAMGDNWFDAK